MFAKIIFLCVHNQNGHQELSTFKIIRNGHLRDGYMTFCRGDGGYTVQVISNASGYLVRI